MVFLDSLSKGIISVLIVILIILAGAMVYFAFSGSSEELVEENFGKLTMKVPEDANFQNNSVQTSLDVAGYMDTKNNIQLYYVPSIAEDSLLQATESMLTPVDSSEYNGIEVENQTILQNLNVYEYTQTPGVYYVIFTVDDFTIQLVGTDLDLLVRMMCTVKVTGDATITENNITDSVDISDVNSSSARDLEAEGYVYSYQHGGWIKTVSDGQIDENGNYYSHDGPVSGGGYNKGGVYYNDEGVAEGPAI